MKKWLCYLLICSICLQGLPGMVVRAETEAVQVNTPEELQELYAQSAVLMDADSGRILFEKNGYEKRPMASTTKIMTCILALEIGELDEEVQVSANAASQPKVHLGMTAGQKFTLRDLLYSLMLESHNDSAVAIAEHISGSVEDFADLMNQKASDLGLEQTHFITPNGLDGKDEGGAHATTAAELATIMRYCMMESKQREMFLEITGTLNHSFMDLEQKRQYHCQNHNAFLGMMEGAVSGKTGFTSKAGYCYVGALKQGERSFIVALLACGWPNHKNYKWSDTKKLMQYALDHYQYENVWETFQETELFVENGVTKESGLFEQVSVRIGAKTELEEYPVLLAAHEDVEIQTEMTVPLTAPIQKGMEVGCVSYQLNGKTLLTVPLITRESVAERNFPWILNKIFYKAMLKNIN